MKDPEREHEIRTKMGHKPEPIDERTDYEIACDAILKAHDQLNKKLNFCANGTLRIAIERLKL